MRPAPRGQAVVEAALGILVFVSILVWGIHLAEMGYLAPKVHEAAASAMWDTTAELMHKHPNDYSPRQKAIKNAGPNAEGLYAAFDGRTNGKKSGSISLVFTGAGNLKVNCSQEDIGDTTQNNLTAYGGGEGGMGCYASAQFEAINFPKRFVDKGPEGFFKTANYPPSLNKLTFCSIGRAENGNCNKSKIVMMLDDWGLSGAANENADCLLQGCTNQPFHDLVEKVYDQAYGGGGAGRAMATAIVGAAPGGDEGKFWMSYDKGPDPGMSGGDSDPANWITNVVNGSRNPAFQTRPNPNRFLGIKDVIK
ncbi:MAG: hypothetical protein ACJ8AT_27060 [Hyalangium sp.]|uniref:hypothetical protein n=1 Tax=Hyalangium sp. TaxID=2028555 RepID=UPI00389AB3EF